MPQFPDSLDCFKTIRGWIDSCCSNHDKCERRTRFPLPKRVIDVGPSDGTRQPFLYETNGEEGCWITLSYQWGETSLNTVITTLDSLTERKSGMALKDMPLTLKDAVTVARNLEVRYLWIDSVCIIQDSKEDLKEQLAQMADIYRHSICTIAAAYADNCQSGFLHPRSFLPVYPVTNAPFINPVKTSYVIPSTGATGDLWIRPPLQPYKFIMQRFGRFAINGWNRLQNRGWVLQETLLAPRTLHYSKEQIFWQCRTCAFAEGDVDKVEFNYWPYFEWQNDKSLLSTAGPDWNQMIRRSPDRWIPDEEYYSIHSNWLRLVNDFASRQLTHRSDLLPAVSAAANEFRRLTDDQYLAGIWKGDLGRGLLWDASGTTEAPTYRAPSWSWASREVTEVEDAHTRWARRVTPNMSFPTEPSWRPYDLIYESLTVGLPEERQLRLLGQSSSSYPMDKFGSTVVESITISAECLIRKAKDAVTSFRLDSSEWSPPPQKTRDVACGTDDDDAGSPTLTISSPCATVEEEDALTLVLTAHLKNYQADYRRAVTPRKDAAPRYWCIVLKYGSFGPDLRLGYKRVGRASFLETSTLMNAGWTRQTMTIF